MIRKRTPRSRGNSGQRPPIGLHSIKQSQSATELAFLGREQVADLPGGVSPTDLRLLALCPLQLWHASRLPFETAAPTLGLALGQVVHAARQTLSRIQRSRYIAAKTQGELWSHAIQDALRAEIDNAFDRHYYLSVFGEVARQARTEWSDRLLALERARSECATEGWTSGLRGPALADTCTPSRTEAEWYDPSLRMHGFCDELWNDAGTARPVELKTSPPSARNVAANRYQVAAYALLARKVEGLRVRICEVEYLGDGTRDRFSFGTKWERAIREAVSRVSEVSRSPAPPEGSPSEDTCGWCPFQNSCPESQAPSLNDAFANLRVFDGIGEGWDIDKQ